MSSAADLSPMNNYQQSYGSSNQLIGFETASRLLAVGGGCLLIVLIFGIILCRLDISAGDRRRSRAGKVVEN